MPDVAGLQATEVDENFPIVFYHEAYIDYRYSPPRLRVFSMNPCVLQNDYIVATLHINNSTFLKKIKLFGVPTEGECPWHWADQCYYNSYIFESNLEYSLNIEKIVINLGWREIPLHLKRVLVKKEEGLTICVQPVYWYSQFHNVLLFIESWRSKGATQFIVYFHSSTNDVWKVLDYYNKLGILTIVPWPEFGLLHPKLSRHFPTVDSSSYRVGHTLAQNLCILRMNTELGSIVDFDEVITNGKSSESLLNYARTELSRSNIGALRFPHSLVEFSPRISSFDFSGVPSPIFKNRTGPPKIIFNTNVVDIISTHSIKSFIGQMSITDAEGSLLHFRHNSYTEVADRVEKSFRFFDSNSSLHLDSIRKDANKIFLNRVPEYNSTYLQVLNKCVKDIVKTNKCRSTVVFCKHQMEALTRWKKERRAQIFVS